MLIYSGHARLRMRQRGVEEWEIEYILKHPKRIVRSSKGTLEAHGEIRERKLKVVFEPKIFEGEKYIRIVSVQLS